MPLGLNPPPCSLNLPPCSLNPPPSSHAAVRGTTLSCRSLEDKAREYNIADVSGFLASREFRDSGFVLQRDAGRVVLVDA